MTNVRSVLISGAGIAGPTLAYWLAEHGFRPTVVERAGAPRSSGSPVDVRGPAVDVVEQMGVTSRLRASATAVTDMLFVDERGRRVGAIDVAAFQGGAGKRELEIPRGDLATALFEAGRERAEYVFGDAIRALVPDAEGVDVSFERGGERRFDLVIGADGLHSVVRRLAFGEESRFVRALGMFIATVPLEGVEDPRTITMFNAPGRSLTVHPSRAHALAAFIFRSDARLDARDDAGQRALLDRTYAGDGWRVPEVLARARTSDAFYFDAVSRVDLPRWSHGRVALVGDAASCVSLFGDGSTLAITGAHTLARELAASPADPIAAFDRYERTHRRLVEPKQRGMMRGSHLLVPDTRLGIHARNFVTRLWPAVAAVARLTRRAA